MNHQVSSVLEAAQQIRVDEADRIVNQLRNRRGVTLAVCPGDGSFTSNSSFTKTLSMIEGYCINTSLVDFVQHPPLPANVTAEIEALLDQCVDAFRASSAPFSLLIHVRGWDTPKLYAAEGERCGIPDLLFQLWADVQSLEQFAPHRSEQNN